MDGEMQTSRSALNTGGKKREGAVHARKGELPGETEYTAATESKKERREGGQMIPPRRPREAEVCCDRPRRVRVPAVSSGAD